MPPRAPLLALAALAWLAAAPARAADEDREFCADRPGLNTPPCTLASGTAMAEVGGLEWDHTRDRDTIEDDLLYGETLLRVGIAQSAELQLEFGGYAVDRFKDRASGAVSHARGVGEGTIALRRGLAGPNGPVAIQAFVTLPLAKDPVGPGDYEAGVLLPMSFKLPAEFELALTPEVDLAADEDGRGHHARWGSVIGISHDVAKDVQLTLEASAFRDDDPGDHTTDARVAGSLAWQAGNNLQLDVEGDIGLTHGAPDHALLLGFARRF